MSEGVVFNQMTESKCIERVQQERRCFQNKPDVCFVSDALSEADQLYTVTGRSPEMQVEQLHFCLPFVLSTRALWQLLFLNCAQHLISI